MANPLSERGILPLIDLLPDPTSGCLSRAKRDDASQTM
jgi:hypothetical protein